MTEAQVYLNKSKTLTAEMLTDALERYDDCLDNPGFCLACGCEHEGIEPDARRYECEECGELKVYGAQEIALMVF